MRTLSIILLLFSFITGNGQSSNDLQHLNTSPIITKEQNIKWLKIIDSLSLHDKVIFLSERINNDTNIYVYQKGKDVIRLEPGRETFLSSKLKGCCKPVLMIEGKIIHLFFDGPTTYARMPQYYHFSLESRGQDYFIYHSTTTLLFRKKI